MLILRHDPSLKGNCLQKYSFLFVFLNFNKKND